MTIAAKRINCAHALLLVLIVQAVALAAPAVFADGSAYAQEEKENKKAPLKGRKVEALSKRVYESITRANELVDQEQYSAALKELDKVKSLPTLTAYETAQLYSFYGFLYFNAERYREAINAYDTVLKQPDLPPAVQQQAIRTLAQLSFVTENFDGAIKYANQYLNDVGPDADMYVVLGTAYYQKEQYSKIIPPVEKAISMTREKGGNTKESWWLLLRVAYWEQNNYKKVRDILETLVNYWPKKEYWIQLAGVYSELKDDARQLAAYEAAHDQGMLQSSSELVTLSQLFMQLDAPYKGAKVLEEGLAAGKIDKNVRNLRLQAQAWQMAQDDKKAIAPLRQAASMSSDGNLFAMLATSHLNLSQYKECVDASNKAIGRGGLKNQGETYLVLGMCQFERKSLASAKKSFQNASRFDKSRSNATAWIGYVNSEQERLKQLEQSLNQAKQGGGRTQAPALDASDTEQSASDQPAAETT